ncbi:MAG: hypothetical protein GQ574_01145 [Crocinitomix sp.]|nr:hypothetical protein [Crocinitomix sp.]
MSDITNLYPSLAEVINLDFLPKKLEFLENFVVEKGTQIYLKDLQLGHSYDNSIGSYRMSFHTYRDLDLPIYGDLAFVIAPPGADNLSVAFDYKWTLLRYVNRFSFDFKNATPLEILADSLEEMLEIVIDLSGYTPITLFEKVLKVFFAEELDALNEFVGSFNAQYASDITIPSEPTFTEAMKIIDVFEQMTNEGKQLVKTIYEVIVNIGDDLDEKIDRVKDLFKTIFNDVTDDLLDIIQPEIQFNLQLPSVGIRFPGTWLKPVDEFGEDLPDSLAYLTCDNIGGISYKSGEGFYFDLFNDVTYSLPLCRIGNTALILSVTELKLDLRDDKNIPEATADGRSNEFKGVFISEATISFPNFFSPEDGNTATIVARNLLVGSEGGLSGTIGLQADGESTYINLVPTDVDLDFSFDEETKEMVISGNRTILIEGDPETDEDDTVSFVEDECTITIPEEGLSLADAENNYFNITGAGVVTALVDPPDFGVLEFGIGGENKIIIEDFFLTFSKNKVVSSTVTGKIDIDAFEEPLNMTIDFTNGFKIHVSYPYPEIAPLDEQGIEAMDNNIFTLTLRDLELGRINEKFFVGLTGKLTNNLDIPFVNKFVPKSIFAELLKWTQGDGFDYDLTFEWAIGLKLGLSNDGPPELEESTVRIPFNQKKEDGLFKLDGIDLTIVPVEDGVSTKVKLVGASLNLKKKFIFTVDGLGAEVILTKVADDDEIGGNIGPFNAAFNLIPPKGLGIAVKGDNISGGGYVFLDFEKGRYVGVAELRIKDKVTLKVIGIITTKLPSGEKGNSILLLVTAEFTPQDLAFGFTLNGVGGLVAINRTMNLQALRDGVKNNAIDNVMFPDDPVKNIAQIVSDLETIFPVQKGRYTFGIMGLIGWGTLKGVEDEYGNPKSLVTMEIGLMLEVPKPVRLAVLGVIKSILPTEKNDVVKLQVNFVGTIDFGEKYITFDASIYESNFVTFALAGDMAFRLKWGDEPNFLFSVGGFHPAYTPPPLNLPTMNRLMINFLAEENPRLTLSTYLAITSNTVQMGALLDFYYNITNNIQVIGALGFDVLIQFSPFYLRAELYAMMAVVRNNQAVLSVSLYGMLEGPKPWHVQGKAEFVFLKMNLKANFDKTFGEEDTSVLPDVEVMPLVEIEGDKNKNWQAILPSQSNTLVSLKEQGEGVEGIILSHPNGSLRFAQQIVPLHTTINKFGKQVPSDYNQFSLSIEVEEEDAFIAMETTPTKEFFAPADFIELSDNEKLARKSFEKMDAGIKVSVTDSYKTSAYRTRQLAYEKIVYDSTEFPETDFPLQFESAENFQTFVNNNDTSNSELGKKSKAKSNFTPNKLKLATETFKIANLEDLSVFTEDDEELSFDSQAEAHVAMAKLLINNPALVDQIDVVLEHELA